MVVLPPDKDDAPFRRGIIEVPKVGAKVKLRRGMAIQIVK